MTVGRKLFRIVQAGPVELITSPPHMAGYRDLYYLQVTRPTDGARSRVNVSLDELRALRDALNGMDSL